MASSTKNVISGVLGIISCCFWNPSQYPLTRQSHRKIEIGDLSFDPYSKLDMFSSPESALSSS